MYIIVKRLHFQQFRAALQAIHPSYLILYFLVALSEQFLFAQNWRLLLRATKIDVPFSRMLHITFTSGFFGLFLPTSIGTDLSKLQQLSRHKYSFSHVLSALFMGKLLAIAALIGLSALGLGITAASGLAVTRHIFQAIIIAAFGCAAVFHIFTTQRYWRFLARRLIKMPHGISDKIIRFHDSMSLLIEKKQITAQVGFICLIIQLFRVFEVYILTHAFDLNTPVFYLLGFVPLIMIISLLPISIAGIGVREGAFVYFLAYIGIAPETAFMFSLIMFSVSILVGLIGGMVFLFGAHPRLQGTAKAAGRKLVILHVIDKLGSGGSSIHGVSRLLSWWFPRFDGNRFALHLCVIGKRDRAGAAMEEKGINIRYLNKIKFDMTALWALKKEVSRVKPDILHLHGFCANTAGRVVSWITGIPSIIHEHSPDVYPTYMYIPDRILSRISPVALAVSKSTREWLVNTRAVPPETVKIVYNGIPLDEFRPVETSRVDALRNEFKVSPQTIVIGSVGRLSREKCLDDVIRAARIVVEKHTDVLFLLAGDGAESDNLQALIDRYSLQPAVKLLGFRKDVADLLTFFDIFLVPSALEGFPLAALEAMSVGRAVVATSADGLGELFTNEKDALIVPCHMPVELAAAVMRLIDDRDLRGRLASQARASAQRYDIGRYIDGLQDIYARLSA